MDNLLGVLLLGLALVMGVTAAGSGSAPPPVANQTYPNATFIPGWCDGCSRAQGIYVAVFIGFLGAGGVAALVFGLWGFWRGKQLDNARQYRTMAEDTAIGHVVSLELSELSKKPGSEDYF